MKKIFTLVAMVLATISVNAQNDEEMVYYEWTGYEELLPGKPFIYRYVQARDEESEKALSDWYAEVKQTDDKSILKRNEGGWFVKNDYPLPEGNYYESAFYKRYMHEDNGITYIILPKIEVLLKDGGDMNTLLEHFGDKVTFDTENVYYVYDESPTAGLLNCDMSSSKEVLEAISHVYEIDQSFINYISPIRILLYDETDGYLLSVLKGSANDTAETGEKLIYEKNWEGAWSGIYDGEDIWQTTDQGLAIINPMLWENMWDGALTHVSSEGISLEKGHDYIVRLTMKVPSDGTYWMSFGVWTADTEAWATTQVAVTAVNDFQVIDFEFPEYPGTAEGNAWPFLGSGWVVGTTVLKKTEIIEKTVASVRTAINPIKSAKLGDDALYNLAGQKVDAAYKGIVIKNGKKLFQK